MIVCIFKFLRTRSSPLSMHERAEMYKCTTPPRFSFPDHCTCSCLGTRLDSIVDVESSRDQSRDKATVVHGLIDYCACHTWPAVNMKTLEFLAALLLIAAATSRGQEQNAADPEVVRPGETTSLTTLSPSPTTRSPDEPTEEPSEDSSSSQEETTEETVEEPVARPSTGPPVHLVNDCDYVYHNLTYEVDGCRGAVPVASCDGYCVSDMAPEFFPSR